MITNQILAANTIEMLGDIKNTVFGEDVLKDLECNTAHLYFNVTTKAETFGRHKDTMDVYYWQCQGVTQWIVEDKNVILNPGDLIYIPSGMYHSVTPLSPRLGISMSK